MVVQDSPPSQRQFTNETSSTTASSSCTTNRESKLKVLRRDRNCSARSRILNEVCSKKQSYPLRPTRCNC